MNRKEAWDMFVTRLLASPVSPECKYLDMEGRYCVVGHALSVAGVSDETLKDMNDKYENIITSQPVEICNKLQETYGVSLLDWYLCQTINDKLNDNPLNEGTIRQELHAYVKSMQKEQKINES